MSNLAKVSTRHEVGIITIDNPPVNALSSEVCEHIDNCLDAVASNTALKAIILIGAGRTFVAGADINELANASESDRTLVPKLVPLLSKLEGLNKPVVAALHGTALGGGLELAMAAHYRVAAADTKLGQPEINLGLIPGGQGTQRLPRLVGLSKAVEMCISGTPINACEAKNLGLVDRIVDGDLLSGAISFAQEMCARSDPHPKASKLRVKPGRPEENAAILRAARSQAAKLRRNMFAPLAALDGLEAATVLPFEKGCKKRQDCSASVLAPQSQRRLSTRFWGNAK